LLQTYDWYRAQDNVQFRTKLIKGGVNFSQLGDDETPLRNYIGRLEFLAILIHYRLIADGPATEIFGTTPSTFLFRARDFINSQRKGARPRLAIRLQEWVAMQGRNWFGRLWPKPLYLWWYWTMGPGTGHLVPPEATATMASKVDELNQPLAEELVSGPEHVGRPEEAETAQPTS
jgi:hypothetical protein